MDELEDDLAIFGGQMKVLDRKGKHGHQKSSSVSGGGSITTATSNSGSASQSPASTPSSSVSPIMNPTALNLGSMGLEMPDVHPSLITYLNQDAVRRAIQAGQSVSAQGSPTQQPTILAQFRPQQQDNPGLGGANSTLPTASYGFNTSNFGAPSSDDWSRFGTFGENNNSSAESSRSAFGFYQDADSSMGMRGEQVERSQLAASSRLGTNPILQGFGTMPSMYSGPNNPLHRAQSTSQYFSQPSYMHAAAAPDPYDDMHTRGGMGTNLPSGSTWVEGSGNPMDTAGAVEIGLSGESRMEAGWMALMRDYGIMDSS